MRYPLAAVLYEQMNGNEPFMIIKFVNFFENEKYVQMLAQKDGHIH